jgi:peptide chain release factor subunit 1
MVGNESLQSLLNYAGPNKVLSLYLNTDLAHHPKEGVILRFRQSIKDVAGEAVDEVARLEHFITLDYDWQGRGLAAFVAGNRLWQVHALPIPVETRAAYGPRPDVRGLVDVLDRLGRFAVALIDRESVRLFAIEWGEIRAETESFGEEIKRHKQGGWAAARYQRREDNLALQNMKQAVELIEAFCAQRSHGRLILAGGNEALAQVRDLLPRAMQEMVIGELAADMQIGANDLREAALQLAARWDAQEEDALVQQAVTAAAKGGAGSTGLADTLYSLHQGAVRTLLVAEDFHAAGYVCEACGYLGTEAAPACPFCHQEAVRPTSDVANLALFKALQTGAQVNIVRGNTVLQEAGGIAALNRY